MEATEKNYENLVKKYNHLFTKGELEPFAMFGFECGDGWYDILEMLIDQIDRYIKQKQNTDPIDIQIVQVKEKFGGLRFYIDGGDDAIYEIIRFVEELSYKTCEFCGSNQKIMRSKGWIVTACEPCTLTRERLQNRQWVKVN